MEDNEEESTIDFSKVTNLFKKGKKGLENEEKKVEEKIEKEEEKLEKLEEQKEEAEEKEEEIQENIEDEKEKLDALKKKEERLKKEQKSVKKKEKEIKEEEKGIGIDLKKIKGIFKGRENAKTVETKESEFSFDPKSVWNFVKRHKTIFLLIIVIFFSTYYRAYPINLPVTDDWARSTVYENIKGGIASQVSQQYPNLPDQQKNVLIQKQFDQTLNQQGGEIEEQIRATSEYFKSRMQDEDGQTYLLAIDPWLAYGYARNYVTNGHWGNEIINGESWYTLRNGREGQKASFRMLPYIMVLNYKILNIFTDSSMLTAAFTLPLILMTIAAIAAFFIGKKIGGYPAGLTAGIIVGVHAALLNRTAAGFTDTDNLLVCFGLLTVMFFVLAFEEKNKIKFWSYISLAGVSMGLYAIGHGQSWWYIFDAIMGAIILYFVYYVLSNRKEVLKNSKEFIKNEKIKSIATTFVGFGVSTLVFGVLILWITGSGFFRAVISMVTGPISQPLNYMQFKQVAVKTIWPNVLTTVAELNRSSFSGSIAQIGGKLLFFLSIIGIAILLFKKEKGERKYLFYGLLIGLWFFGTLYASTTSLRFVEMLVSPFALAIAAFVAFTYSFTHKWMSKEIHISPLISKSIIIIVFLLIIFAPILKAAEATARREVPSMNDAWYESLIGIQKDSNDAIITSWWDFGHWFVAVAERRVTFDGGNQGERIHWAGKSLLTSDEDMAIGILRMLNCGQEQAPHVLEKYLDNDTVKAVSVLNRIMVENKATARMILSSEGLNDGAIEEVLNVTHCEDLIPQYYITSEDMIGKAGVWGHFGSWNFTKASMYNKVKNAPRENGIKILTDNFSLTEEEANDIYYEIKTTDADRWVSPWPGYTGAAGCSVKGEMVSCGNGLQVNLTNYDAKVAVQGGTGVPSSLVYADKYGVNEKVFANSNIGLSAALIPDGKGYRSVLMDPLHAKGMFTRLFFFESHGLKCFDLLSYKKSFTGNEIYVWKIDWSCKTANIIDEFKEKEVIDIIEEPEEENNTNATKIKIV